MAVGYCQLFLRGSFENHMGFRARQAKGVSWASPAEPEAPVCPGGTCLSGDAPRSAGKESRGGERGPLPLAGRGAVGREAGRSASGPGEGLSRPQPLSGPMARAFPFRVCARALLIIIIFNLYLNIADLQCCVSFCHRTKWVSGEVYGQTAPGRPAGLTVGLRFCADGGQPLSGRAGPSWRRLFSKWLWVPCVLRRSPVQNLPVLPSRRPAMLCFLFLPFPAFFCINWFFKNDFH